MNGRSYVEVSLLCRVFSLEMLDGVVATNVSYEFDDGWVGRGGGGLLLIVERLMEFICLVMGLLILLTGVLIEEGYSRR